MEYRMSGRVISDPAEAGGLSGEYMEGSNRYDFKLAGEPGHLEFTGSPFFPFCIDGVFYRFIRPVTGVGYKHLYVDWMEKYKVRPGMDVSVTPRFTTEKGAVFSFFPVMKEPMEGKIRQIDEKGVWVDTPSGDSIYAFFFAITFLEKEGELSEIEQIFGKKKKDQGL